MFTYDPHRICFVKDGRDISLSEQQKSRMRSLGWSQAMPFAPDVLSPGQQRCFEQIPRYFFPEMPIEGNSFLGVGCRDGFQLFLVEALGASRVAAVSDDLGITPPVAGARDFTKEVLGSNLELLDIHIEEVCVEKVGQFDYVFLFDTLSHVADPSATLKRISAIARHGLMVANHVVVGPPEYSACLRLPTSDGKYPTRYRHAFTYEWLRRELSDLGRRIEYQRVSDYDYLTMWSTPQPPLPGIKATPLEMLPTDHGTEDRTAVVVMSCRLYEQCWRPFFTLFERYWPDCPYKVYLGTDSGSYPGVETIQLGQDRQWATNILAVLERINADRIILFQEDFLLNGAVDTDQVRRLVRHSRDHEVGSLRMHWHPTPTGTWAYTNDLGIIGPFDDFRFTFQLSIWDKRFYSSLMNHGENPWQTEFNAGRRAVGSGRLFLGIWPTTKIPVPYFQYAVDKGVWIDSALEFLRDEGISLEGITKVIRKS